MPDDRHDIARRHHSVEHADLEGRRQDVRQEQHLLIAQLLRDLVDGVIGERHPRELSLQAIDQMAKDPSPAAQALPVAAFPAEAAPTAGAHAGHQHAVAWRDRAHPGADLHDCADGLVAEHRAGDRLGDVAFEYVQIGAADRRGIDPHDRVGGVDDARIIDRVPAALSRTVVDESLHRDLLAWGDRE